ncbi:MAG: winged helix-turn-helix transcriptional regulator [Methanomassiliicoccales archaeon]|nr:MAG: winged helix-turn-helix transcriptional regulator [Methanomassiliicoccales archaeon]
MPRGVGKALERAITTKERGMFHKEEVRDGKSEFMNINRKEIFQYLCLHPCSYTSMICKALGLSLHTTNWHLRRLVESEYISKIAQGKNSVYYPAEMIAVSDVPILEILNNEKARAIYVAIAEKSGSFQGEICKILGLQHQAVIWYTKKLESLGLISSLEDGKYRRYYLTELLNRKKEENAMRMKLFRDWIVKRFQREMLSTTILRLTEDKIVLRIEKGGSKAVLTLHTNPFVTVLS